MGRERRSARQHARPSPLSQRRGARGTRPHGGTRPHSDARRAVGRAAARPPQSATAGPCTSTRVTCCRSVCDARRRSDHWTGGAWCWGREGRAPGTQRPRRKGRVSSSPGRLPRDSEARLQRPHADTCDSAPGNGTRSGGEAGKGQAEPQGRWGSRAVSCLPPGPRRGRTATV